LSKISVLVGRISTFSRGLNVGETLIVGSNFELYKYVLKKESIIEEASKFQKHPKTRMFKLKKQLKYEEQKCEMDHNNPHGRGWKEAHPFLRTWWKYPSTKTDKYIPPKF